MNRNMERLMVEEMKEEAADAQAKVKAVKAQADSAKKEADSAKREASAAKEEAKILVCIFPGKI